MITKTNQCKICGWGLGKTHRHHIIPLSEEGEDCEENIIEICPNHHAEATFDYEMFNKEFGLTGKKNSDII